MPAHHRFHPYEIQLIALYVSLLPCLAAIFLAFAGQRLESIHRRGKPPAVVTRGSQPVFLGGLAGGARQEPA
jgi:hypothetical protein